MSIDHFDLFGGIPFASENFLPERVLAAVSVVRRDEADRAGISVSTPTELFDPAVALKIRQSWLRQSVEYTVLTEDHSDAIRAALDEITAAVPLWRPLLHIPVYYRLLQNSTAISASSFAWPQHVFLGVDAFDSVDQLAEQLVHELCHCWLYFMEEVAPINMVTGRKFQLPSGTDGRESAEVLGALHVAVALRELWRSLRVPEVVRRGRLDALEGYASACNELIAEIFDELTFGGQQLARELERILERSKGRH